MADICGIDAETIREVAHAFGRAERAMIFWGMGISQHVHGTDNARCLIALALMCGQVGRPGTGLHPLRGQNNVQGASDAGLIPMFYPDYADVTSEGIHKKFEELWKTPLSKKPGLTVVEIINAANAGEIRGMYHPGREPRDVGPRPRSCAGRHRQARALVVQDIFLTETAMMADVDAALFGVAGEDRARSPTPTGRCRWAARRCPARRHARGSVDHGRAGQAPWARLDLHPSVRSVRRDEARHAVARQHHLGAAGAGILGHLSLPRARSSGRGDRVRRWFSHPVGPRQARCPPMCCRRLRCRIDEYPLVLMTGRQLEHWHTGAMTRRADVLDPLEPGPTASLNPATLGALRHRARRKGAGDHAAGQRSSSLPGPTGHVQEGTIFIPFAYVEAAANILTNPQLDPIGKIPEYKYCAVKIEPGAWRRAARAASSIST